MLSTYLIHTATIITPGSGVNSVGDPIVDWDTATEKDVKVWRQPMRSSEDDDLRQMDKEQVRLFLDPSAEINAVDRVRLDGELFELEGPALMRYTTRGPHHQEARCVAVTG